MMNARLHKTPRDPGVNGTAVVKSQPAGFAPSSEELAPAVWRNILYTVCSVHCVDCVKAVHCQLCDLCTVGDYTV